MIVNIRGTSGSGKTFATRRIIELAGKEKLDFVEGRKRPIAHIFPEKLLVIIGSYQTTCGGCDTISKFDDCYEKIDSVASMGHNVLYEGLRQAADVKRINLLRNQGHEVVAITSTTPLEICLEAIRDRRLARGNEKPLNPKNTTSKFNGILRADKRLEEAGVVVHRLEREAAFEKLKELLL